MSNLLPDYTSLNTVLATVSNPQVTALYARRALVCGIGTLMIVAGFGMMIANTGIGKTALKAGAAVATDGASLAAEGVANAAG